MGLGPLEVFITFPKAACDLIKRKMCALFCLSNRRTESRFHMMLFSFPGNKGTIVLNSTGRTPESESKESAAPNVFITQRSRVYTEANKSERLGEKQKLSDQSNL